MNKPDISVRGERVEVRKIYYCLFIMYWFVLGLLMLFKIYTPPKSIIVIAFIMTGVLMAILTFASVPITKVHIIRY